MFLKSPFSKYERKISGALELKPSVLTLPQCYGAPTGPLVKSTFVRIKPYTLQASQQSIFKEISDFFSVKDQVKDTPMKKRRKKLAFHKTARLPKGF